MLKRCAGNRALVMRRTKRSDRKKNSNLETHQICTALRECSYVAYLLSIVNEQELHTNKSSFHTLPKWSKKRTKYSTTCVTVKLINPSNA